MYSVIGTLGTLFVLQGERLLSSSLFGIIFVGTGIGIWSYRYQRRSWSMKELEGEDAEIEESTADAKYR